MQIVDTFQNRLKKIMDIRKIKQVDLVEKTHLDKTLINKYLAGVSKARQQKLTILADALDVNEIWLMGYDVPMERNFANNQNFDNIDITIENGKITFPSNFKLVKIYGQISAGKPNWAEENIEGALPIDPELFGVVNPDECFFIKVKR